MSDATTAAHRNDPNSVRLAALVASRLCHDLVSPLGAIGNGVELLQMGATGAPSPELGLVSDSVDAARARIRVFRVAFGQAGPDQRLGVPELTDLLRDLADDGRLRFQLDAQGDMPRTDARMILLAAMCLETALPWGGRVLVCRGANGWRLVAESTRVRQVPELWAWLDGGADAAVVPAASDVHFALLATHATAARKTLRAEIDDSGAEISF